MSEQPKANDFKHIPGVNDAEYIELLKRALERQKYLTSKAIAKLKKQPEIVRCRDCKFYTSMNPKEKIGICSLACRHLGDDGFCSNAERRTDDPQH